MQRREFIRQPSRAARLALPPAVQSFVLALVAILAHWTDFLSSSNFLIVLAIAAVFALVGAVLSLLGFRALWMNAAEGGRRSALALLFASPVLLIALSALFLAQTTPRLSDISTDVEDPPHFSALVGDMRISNRLEPPAIDAALQSQYKGLTSRRYALSADLIVKHVLDLVVVNGWDLAVEEPQRDADGNWIVEAVARTGVFGFRDAIVIRVAETEEAAFVDMRSASGFGDADLGMNAQRIRRFMADIDTQISLGTVSAR
jgi:heme/copper-type cytochrome/quinol oxidase subunit 4